MSEDDVIDAEVVDDVPGPTPPPVDPPEVRLAQSLAFALMTACEREDGQPQPYPIPMPAVVKIAQMLIGHGWERTGEVTDAALPSWLVERSRQDAQAQEVPTEPDMSVPLPTERVCHAPKPPKNKKNMRVVR